jgi:hypothetical protein
LLDGKSRGEAVKEKREQRQHKGFLLFTVYSVVTVLPLPTDASYALFFQHYRVWYLIVRVFET